MVSDPTAGATYVYDGNGNRVQKCLPNCTSPTSSIVYLFSGSQDIAEYNNGAAPSSPSSEFIYSDSLPGSGLLASIVAGTTTYFHSDHLGWRVSTNTGGQVVGQQGTFPFGESWYSSSANEFVFTSYQRDSESGLDYAMARYYDSTVGRFCSADPVGGEMDDPQTWNRYAYSRNDPIDFTDPNGQHWWNWVLDIGSIAAMIFAPEIEGFLEDEFPLTFGGGAGAPAGFVPQFSVRVATEAAAEAAGDAAAAGASGGGIDAVATLTATAAQAADDQPKPQQQGRPQVSPALTPCQQKVLNAVNKQFGTNGNASDVSPSSNPLPASGGEVNVNFNFNSGLTATQFNAIQPGRYAPAGFWGWLTGYGPSLHVVAGPSSLDTTAMTFANSNVGGNLSASFTAHIDSAWAYNPIGALLHWKIDVRGHATRNPCP